MKFHIEKYKNINIASGKKSNIKKCKIALDKIMELDERLFLKVITGSTRHIILGNFEQGNAFAAAFADEKVLVLTLPNLNNVDLLISVIVHEGTHVYHYKTDPKEYADQLKAEKMAFRNELKILKLLGNEELIKETKKIMTSFFRFLRANKTTAGKSEGVLKRQNSAMSLHQKLLDQYLVQLKKSR